MVSVFFKIYLLLAISFLMKAWKWRFLNMPDFHYHASIFYYVLFLLWDFWQPFERHMSNSFHLLIFYMIIFQKLCSLKINKYKLWRKLVFYSGTQFYIHSKLEIMIGTYFSSPQLSDGLKDDWIVTWPESLRDVKRLFLRTKRVSTAWEEQNIIKKPVLSRYKMTWEK